MTLRVVARIAVRPDKVTEAKAILSGFIAPTRKESGCISYVLLQNNADPTDFTFVEEWESDAALDAHLKTPHISAGLEKMPSLVTGPPDIRRYSVVG
jgi:quinol monooxygenase YgiN